LNKNFVISECFLLFGGDAQGFWANSRWWSLEFVLFYLSFPFISILLPLSCIRIYLT